MTDRDRLIVLYENSLPKNNGVYQKKDIEEAVDYLLANGVSLSPLPIGSTVYEIRAKGTRKFYRSRVYNYGIATMLSLKSALDWDAELFIAPKKFCRADKTRLNKFIFETEQQAENKLKEYLQNAKTCNT